MTLQGAVAKSAAGVGWRTPMGGIICGCLISMISFGPRSSLGFFLTPLSQANHWEREVFALALAIQNLLWGIGQPFAGAIAKLVPPNWRSTAFGFGTAAGWFGQFLYSPLAVALMDAYSWQTALTIFAGLMLLILPLSIAFSTPRRGPANISV